MFDFRVATESRIWIKELRSYFCDSRCRCNDFRTTLAFLRGSRTRRKQAVRHQRNLPPHHLDNMCQDLREMINDATVPRQRLTADLAKALCGKVVVLRIAIARVVDRNIDQVTRMERMVYRRDFEMAVWSRVENDRPADPARIA